MAYKPKYRRSEEPAPKLTTSQLAVTAVSVALSLVLTLGLLALMVMNVGSPGTTVEKASGNFQVMDRLDSFLSDTVEPLRAFFLPKTGGEEEPTIETVKKTYTLNDKDLVAPEPDQALFGETEDPEVLREVIAQAADILEGQTLYFDLSRERGPSNVVRYYLDDTIFVLTWQEGHEDSAYTMSEVKVAHASQFRRYLSDGVYGSEKQYYTTEMAATVNAVVASSGDFYRFRNFGVVVYEGQARRISGTYAETCYIDINGDMSFTYGGDITTKAKAQDFVDENNIRFSLCFGPILVDNYKTVDHSWYGVGEINEEYARAALCQMDSLHYLLVTANRDKGFQKCHTVATFQKHIAATGCKMAYCLDGGQTAAIVMNDELINNPAMGEQRQITDIIYFATAIPEGE